MNDELYQLSAEYNAAQINKDIEKPRELIKKMKENLKNLGITITDDMSYNDLLAINNEYNRYLIRSKLSNLFSSCEHKQEIKKVLETICMEYTQLTNRSQNQMVANDNNMPSLQRVISFGNKQLVTNNTKYEHFLINELQKIHDDIK